LFDGAGVIGAGVIGVVGGTTGVPGDIVGGTVLAPGSMAGGGE
jgi:hypothetical protein